MARFRVLALLLVLAPLLAGCAGSGTRSGETSIDRSFTTTGLRWQEGGVIYLFLKAREGQGKVEVCAAWMFTGGAVYTYRLNDNVLEALSLSLGGKRVLTGLRFAHALPEMDVVLGQQASCVRTGTDWKPELATADFDLEVPRMRFVL